MRPTLGTGRLPEETGGGSSQSGPRPLHRAPEETAGSHLLGDGADRTSRIPAAATLLLSTVVHRALRVWLAPTRF